MRCCGSCQPSFLLYVTSSWIAATLNTFSGVGVPSLRVFGQGSLKYPPGAGSAAAAFCSSVVGGKVPVAVRSGTPSGGFRALLPDSPGMKNGKPGLSTVGAGGAG